MCFARPLKSFSLLFEESVNIFWYGAANRIQTIPFKVIPRALSTVGALLRPSILSFWGALLLRGDRYESERRHISAASP